MQDPRPISNTGTPAVPPPAVDSHLRAAYRDTDLRHRQKNLHIACWLAIAIVPGGVVLDYTVYPEAVWQLAAIRACNVVGLALLLLVVRHRDLSLPALRVLGVVWAYLICGCLAAMVAVTGGYTSTYYAGINLVILGLGVLLPFTARETLIVCMGRYAMWLLGIAPSLWQAAQPVAALPAVVNASFFILATSAICLTASHFNSRARFRDFVQRQTLDEQNRQLATMDQLKTDFFANVSHELRTPLTLIIAPLEQLLGNTALTGPERETLELVRGNALRLLSLINDLLEIVKLDHGSLALRREAVVLDDYLAATAASIRPLMDRKEVELRLASSQDGHEGENGEDDDGTPTVVAADRDQLDKILLNLLSNAVKFTPPGGSVTLTWRRIDDAATIEIRDTGVGIPAEDLPHIFERFRQVDGSATRHHRGVGLGLALVHELVQAHGGSLEVDSEVGSGTTFTLQLPLWSGSPDDADADAPTIAPTTTGEDPIARAMTQADRHTLHLLAEDRATTTDRQLADAAPDDAPAEGDARPGLLIVDDEPQMRHYLVQLFADRYRVRSAADGDAALALVADWTPDLVISDMMMPGMTGIELTQRLRDQPRFDQSKIIMLTARADDRTKLEALDHGVDDFLAKPFSATEISTRLRNLLRTVRLQRDLRRRNAELQETLDRLGQAEAQLVQSEKMNALGSLAAGLLHEINNPLNFTMAAVQLLQEDLDPADADGADILDDVVDGMRRIRDIITDLRAFAYPEEQDLQDVFPLREALRQALRFTAHECRGITVVEEVPPAHHVLASQTQVTQVLVNLLANAAKATWQVRDEREPTITIASQIDGDRLTVTVADNGTGIAEEHRQRIFDPFFTTRDVGEGLGLGLSICHTIVANHGGGIAAHNNMANGTRIVFDLPLADPGNPR